MALVAYDISDSENENEEDENVENNEQSEVKIVTDIFSTLPAPKRVVEIPEEDVEDIPANNVKPTSEIPKKPEKKPVRITIPSLKDYDNVEEDLPPKKIQREVAKATGLFSVLPPPKVIPLEKPKIFDAEVVKKNNLVPRSVKNNQTEKVAKKNKDSDDEENDGKHFFSTIFNDDNNTFTVTSSKNLNLKRNFDSAKPVQDVNSKTNEYFANLVANPKVVDEANEQDKKTDDLDEAAFEELCGKRRKKNKEDIQIVDINAADIMPDSREWMTKALTEEKPTVVKKGEEPSLQSRRKHQITYLAYQAKMNEQELKNQWALNRLTRKQTQAKYGF